MNPYEADPIKIPPKDRYADVPFYGRYHPRSDDFKPDASHVNSETAEAHVYWKSVLARCDASVRIYENVDGGRDVFALGSVIVKSSHLRDQLEGRCAHRDYSYADKNEVEATALARKVLKGVRVPDIYFAGKIDGRDVLVQERLPGVGLNVAWQYLTPFQKAAFKRQARAVLDQLQTIKPTATRTASYVVPDSDPIEHRGILDMEKDILFSDEHDGDLSFMHNDFTHSNCIVDNDRIVGLVDWEMAGFFGWNTAAQIHQQIRSPQRESYAALKLPDGLLDDILFWNDLYASGANK